VFTSVGNPLRNSRHRRLRAHLDRASSAHASGFGPWVSPSRTSPGAVRRLNWACLAVGVLLDDRQWCASPGDGEIGRRPQVCVHAGADTRAWVCTPHSASGAAFEHDFVRHKRGEESLCRELFLMRCCAGDEGWWPFGVALQGETSSRLMRPLHRHARPGRSSNAGSARRWNTNGLKQLTLYPEESGGATTANLRAGKPVAMSVLPRVSEVYVMGPLCIELILGRVGIIARPWPAPTDRLTAGRRLSGRSASQRSSRILAKFADAYSTTTRQEQL
jgi:hypothetical protein